MYVALIALFLVVLVGLCICFGMQQCKWKGLGIAELLTLPLVLPPVVVGFGLLIVFSSGYLFCAWLKTHGLGVIFSVIGAILASAVISFPFFYQKVRSALQSIDHNIEDVARTLGASEFRIFCTISIPLAWKGILTGAILFFCRGMGEFGATILIADNIPDITRTMPLVIYSFVKSGQYGDAFNLVIYICVLTVGLLSSIHLITKGSLFRHSNES